MRRAAHAAMTVRKLAERRRTVDASAPIVTMALHTAHVLVGKITDHVEIDMAARHETWQTLDRVLTRAGPGDVVVSAATAAALRPSFALAEAGEGAFRLGDGERQIPWAEITFVGRREETALLCGRLELARAGRGQVVGITGEPGIGKSRMLLEFRRALRADDVTYVETRCVSYGRNLPLLPAIELVRRAAGLDEHDSAAIVETKLRSCLAGLGMPSDEIVAYALRLLGIEMGRERLAHVTAQMRHHRSLELLRAMVLAIARWRPLVVAVEDLHWMDAASATYLEALVDAVATAPILLITTARTGYRPPWSERSYVADIRLQPLPRADARAVLDAVLERHGQATDLSEASAETILDRADGNPFFLEELAWAVRTGAATMADVPNSIEAVLMARIDRLADEARAVLQVAAVVGRDVPVRILEAIATEVATRAHLRELEALEYLHDVSDGTQELYRFKHVLTQAVAYSSLRPERCRALHARVVSAIEHQYGDRIGEKVATLAHHAVAGRLWPKAVRYLHQAGLELAGSANREAVDCFERALAMVKHLPADDATVAAIDLRIDLFRALQPLAEYRRGLAYLAEAGTLAGTHGDRRRLGEIRASECLLLRITGAMDDALDMGRQAVEIATEIGDPDLAVTARFFLGTVYQTLGEFRPAAACYEAALTPIEGDLTRERARALHRYAGGTRAWLTWTLGHLGEFAQALAVGREAVLIAEFRDDRLSQVVANAYLGIVHAGRGDFADPIPLLERALTLCRSYDLADWLAPVLMHLGYAYAQTGRLDEGVAMQESGRAHAEAIGALTGHAARLAALAHSYLLAGRRPDALETARQGLALADAQRQPHGAAACHRVLGIAAGEVREVAAAETHLRQACSIATGVEMHPLVAHCHADVGTMYAASGKRDQAREYLLSAAEMYRKMEMAFWLTRTERVLRRLDG